MDIDAMFMPFIGVVSGFAADDFFWFAPDDFLRAAESDVIPGMPAIPAMDAGFFAGFCCAPAVSETLAASTAAVTRRITAESP